MISESGLQVARRLAERAVADMPDGPMKIKAFEVILNRVLPAETSHDATPIGHSAAAAPRRRSAAKRSTAGDHPEVPKTCSARVLTLCGEGFFDQPRGLGEIREELGVKGWIYPVTSLSGTVQALVQRRRLRRTLVQDGKRKIYRYVNP
jgi:hypothetical protein